MHFDYEISDKQFVIREVPTGKVKFKFPRTLLATANNTRQVTEQLKFMKWADNETIRFINISNSEPFEKLIAISALLQSAVTEVASSTMPFFDKRPYSL
jgi:hypothetical protein